MSKRIDITEDDYAGYGFNRREITDFFHSKGKMVNFGLANHQDECLEQTNTSISLEDALYEINLLREKVKELEGKLPIFLGEYRDDDPLLIAIRLRNEHWANYDEENRKTIPAQDALFALLKQQYEDMPDIQARSIEKVACPIKRK